MTKAEQLEMIAALFAGMLGGLIVLIAMYVLIIWVMKR